MNLVTFKIWNKVKDGKFKYGGSLKNLVFRGEVPEKPIYRVELPKKGVGQFPDLRGSLTKKVGVVFLRGVDAHYGY